MLIGILVYTIKWENISFLSRATSVYKKNSSLARLICFQLDIQSCYLSWQGNAQHFLITQAVAAQISDEKCLEAESIYPSLNKLSEHIVAFTFTHAALKHGELSDISSTSFKPCLQGAELPAESLESRSAIFYSRKDRIEEQRECALKIRLNNVAKRAIKVTWRCSSLAQSSG